MPKRQSSLRAIFSLTIKNNRNKSIQSILQLMNESLEIISIQMTTIQILGLLIFLAVAYIVIVVRVKPKRKMQDLKRHFQQKGYRVYMWDFKPLGFSMMDVLFKDSAKGDGFKTYRNIFTKYDVAIGNYLTRPTVQVLNPQLHGKFSEQQVAYKYTKLQDFVKFLARPQGIGLGLLEGQKWRKRRILLSKIFTHEFITSMQPEFASICDFNLNKIQQKHHKEVESCFQFKLFDLTCEISGQVMAQSFLGCQYENQLIEGGSPGSYFVKNVDDGNLQMANPVALLLGPKYLNLGVTRFDRELNRRIKVFNAWGRDYLQRKINKQSAEIKEQGKNYNDKKDVISRLLIENKENTTMTDQELFDEFKFFFIVGTDSTAHYTEMMIQYILKNPQIESKVRAEIEEVMKNDDYSSENLKKLKYIQACQKQTTRLYGPGNMSLLREVVVDHLLDGVPLATGTVVQTHFVGVHESQKYFKDPEVFRPERWLENADEGVLQGFGLQPRTCLGRYLVTVETKIIIVKFFKRYHKVELVKNNISMLFTLFYIPEPFNVRVHIRKD